MRNYILLVFLLLFFSCQKASRQPTVIEDAPKAAGVSTKVILVRHAEKVLDGTSNPRLTKDGIERAEKLADLLKNENIKAIYSTPYKRTTATVKPTSILQNKVVQMYDPSDHENFLMHAIKQYAGGTILIAGHSNTIPIILNILTNSEKYKQLEDDEYGKIFTVHIPYDGIATVVEDEY